MERRNMTPDQRIIEQCPKCGAKRHAPRIENGIPLYQNSYGCGSSADGLYRSDRCRITELSQQLSVAVAALNHICAASDCLEWNSPCDCPCCIAAEALKQIGPIPEPPQEKST